ncbi:hypothetical protein F5Y12DRAFT_453994 [Xylaria sp. FL1777]|nr:hypothetical protein F5Y12DRAFT_453994 [Xylaria sp. FL1777]
MRGEIDQYCHSATVSDNRADFVDWWPMNWRCIWRQVLRQREASLGRSGRNRVTMTRQGRGKGKGWAELCERVAVRERDVEGHWAGRKACRGGRAVSLQGCSFHNIYGDWILLYQLDTTSNID